MVPLGQDLARVGPARASSCPRLARWAVEAQHCRTLARRLHEARCKATSAPGIISNSSISRLSRLHTLKLEKGRIRMRMKIWSLIWTCREESTAVRKGKSQPTKGQKATIGTSIGQQHDRIYACPLGPLLCVEIPPMSMTTTTISPVSHICADRLLARGCPWMSPQSSAVCFALDDSCSFSSAPTASARRLTCVIQQQGLTATAAARASRSKLSLTRPTHPLRLTDIRKGARGRS